MDFKLQFIALAREMQNAECRMQNERVFYENNFNSCALRTPTFCILHFEFCIRQLQLPAKLQSYDTLTDFRMAPMALFSNLETCAWEIPSIPATSIWVLPS